MAKKDSLRAKYVDFMNNQMSKVLDNCSFSNEEIDINYEFDKYMSTPNRNEYYSCLTSKKDYYTKMYFKVKVNLKNSKYSLNANEKIIKLSNIPIPTYDCGIIVKGNSYNYVNVQKLANGWYLEKDNETGNISLDLRTRYGGKITVYKNTRDKYVVKVYDNMRKNAYIDVSKFLIALTGLTVEDLRSKLGEDLAVLNSVFYSDVAGTNIDDCVKEVYSTVFKSKSGSVGNLSTNQRMEILRNRYYKRTDIGEDGANRYKVFISFLHRLIGYRLVEDVTLSSGKVIKANTVLDSVVLTNIDKDESINHLTVYNNDNVPHKVFKYDYSEYLCDNMIFNVFHSYFSFIEGIGNIDDKRIMISKVCRGYANAIEDKITKQLRIATKLILDNYKPSLAFNLKEIPFNKYIKVDEFINDLNRDNCFQLKSDENTSVSSTVGYKVSSDMKGNNASQEMRDIKPDQYGRLCPYDSPERKDIGLNVTMTVNSRLSPGGFIEAEYYKVVGGVATDEKVYLNPVDEIGKVTVTSDVELTSDLADSEEKIQGRRNGEYVSVTRKEVDYQETACNHTLGPTASLIPFIEEEKSKRGVMGIMMTNQALPVFGAQRPYVTTGLDSYVDNGVITASDLLEELISEYNLVDEEEAVLKSSVILKDVRNDVGFRTVYYTTDYPKLKSTYTKKIIFMQGGEKNTIKHYKFNNKENYVYKNDDVIMYLYDVDVNKYNYDSSSFKNVKGTFKDDRGLAVGVNLKVLYKAEGYSYEDAIIINRDLVDDETLSSIRIFQITKELKTNTDFREYLTWDVEGLSAREKGYLTENNGLPKKGTYVRNGDVIISAVRETYNKSESKSSNNQSRLGLKKDNVSKKYNEGLEGYVIDYRQDDIDSETKLITVTIGCVKRIGVGDKLTGRHGNKGVIAKIYNREDMPYFEDGSVPDIVINPLGVLPRDNPSQLTESILGMAGYVLNELQIVPPYVKNNYEYAMSKVKQAGLKPMYIYSGKTGEKYPKKAYMGLIYMMKLNHMAEDAFSCVNTVGKNVKVESLQPKEGKRQKGGQRVSELQNWCLQSCDALDYMQDLQSVQSSDMKGKRELLKAITNSDDLNCMPKTVFNDGNIQNIGKIVRNSEDTIKVENNNDLILTTYLKAIGVNLTSGENGYIMNPVTDEYITDTSREVRMDNNVEHFAALHDVSIFPSEAERSKARYLDTSRKLWGHINLNTKVILPIYLHSKVFLSHFYCVMYSLNKSKGENRLTKNIRRVSESVVKNLAEEKYWVSKDLKVFNSEECMKEYLDRNDLDKDNVYTGYFGVMKFFENYNKDSVEAMLTLNDLDYSLADLYYDDDVIENVTMGVENLEGSEKIYPVRFIDVNDYIVSKLLVIPVGFRPEQKGVQAQEYHNYDRIYNNIMNAVNTRGDYDVKSFQVLYNSLNLLTRGYDSSNKANQLVSFTSRLLSSNLDKTKTVIRGALKGYRVEYSGRSVIVGDPNLSINEFGLPLSMALTFYETHLIKRIRKDETREDLNLNGREPSELKRLIEYVKGKNVESIYERFTDYKLSDDKRYEMAHNIQDYIVELITDIASNFYCVLNREPALHKFNVRGLKPVIIDDNVIHLHPTLCKSFNADFDGDTMSVTTSLTERGQICISNNLAVKNNLINIKDNSLIVTHAQDIVLGLYKLTTIPNSMKRESNDYSDSIECVYNSVEQVKEMLDLQQLSPYDFIAVNVNGKVYASTVGRIVFNSYIMNGEGFTDEPDTIYKGCYLLKYSNTIDAGIIKTIDMEYYKKSIQTADGENVSRVFNLDNYIKFLDDVKDLGFEWSIRSGFGVDFTDFQVDDSIKDDKIKETEEYLSPLEDYVNWGLLTTEGKTQATNAKWAETAEEINNAIVANIDKDGDIFAVIDSKARGSYSNYAQCVGMGGQVTGISGETLGLTIKNNYAKGLNSYEAFTEAYNARKGLISSAVLTQDSGELTKDLVTICQDVTIESEDCGAEAFVLKIKYENLAEECIESIKTAQVENKFYNVTDCDIESFKGKLLNSTIMKALARSNSKFVVIGKDKILLSKVMNPVQRNLLIGRYYQTNYNDERVKGIDYDKFNESCKKYLSKNGFITEEFIGFIERESLEFISYRSTFSCNHEHGVCQKCYGSYGGTDSFPKIGHNIGSESAQAIGEPSTQLTLDTTHAKASEGTITGSVNILKSFIEANSHNSKTYDEPCIYVNKDLFIENKNDLNSPNMDLFVYENFKDKDDFERVLKSVVKDDVPEMNNVYKNRIESLTNNFMYKHYLHMDYDMGRYKLLEDYVNIFYSKKVDVNPINFEIVVRQQTKFFIVTADTSLDNKRLLYGQVLNRKHLADLNVNVSGELSTIHELYKSGIIYPLWVSFRMYAKYANNMLTYLSANRVKEGIVDSVVNKLHDDGSSLFSAQLVGGSYVDRKPKKIIKTREVIRRDEEESALTQAEQSDIAMKSMYKQLSEQLDSATVLNDDLEPIIPDLSESVVGLEDIDSSLNGDDSDDIMDDFKDIGLIDDIVYEEEPTDKTEKDEKIIKDIKFLDEIKSDDKV